jgi:hypothetical protein
MLCTPAESGRVVSQRACCSCWCLFLFAAPVPIKKAAAAAFMTRDAWFVVIEAHFHSAQAGRARSFSLSRIVGSVQCGHCVLCWRQEAQPSGQQGTYFWRVEVETHSLSTKLDCIDFYCANHARYKLCWNNLQGYLFTSVYFTFYCYIGFNPNYKLW